MLENFDDSYTCDHCGDEYFFINSYDFYKEDEGTVYLINGWKGFCDGANLCQNCWDNY